MSKRPDSLMRKIEEEKEVLINKIYVAAINTVVVQKIMFYMI
jgi:hypothetical protein